MLDETGLWTVIWAHLNSIYLTQTMNQLSHDPFIDLTYSSTSKSKFVHLSHVHTYLWWFPWGSREQCLQRSSLGSRLASYKRIALGKNKRNDRSLFEHQQDNKPLLQVLRRSITRMELKIMCFLWQMQPHHSAHLAFLAWRAEKWSKQN